MSVLVRLLAVWRLNSAGLRRQQRVEHRRRICSMPRLAAHDRPYCATQPGDAAQREEADDHHRNQPQRQGAGLEAVVQQRLHQRGQHRLGGRGDHGARDHQHKARRLSAKVGRDARRGAARRAGWGSCSSEADYPMPPAYNPPHLERPLPAQRFRRHAAIALSVILITRNESRHIEACLKSVAFADEWIVVDSGSTDGTRELAESMGARVVVTDDWPGFGVQKGRALALAARSLGAEHRRRRAGERGARAARIRAVVAGGGCGRTGYELARLSSFCGQWMRHGDWYPDRVLRLFRRERGRFSDDLVHERLVVAGPTSAACGGELLHDTMPSARRRARQDEPLHQPVARSTRCAPVHAGGLGTARSGTGCGRSCGVMWSSAGFSTADSASSSRSTMAEGTYYRLPEDVPARPAARRSDKPIEPI